MDLYPTISQVLYWGVGDIDECSILATYWAARAAGFQGNLPSISAFRLAAGRMDRPGPTGLTNAQVWKGVTRTVLASMGATRLSAATSWSDFAATMKMGGYASVAVTASLLPAAYRYGFGGGHRVGLTWSNGQWYIADPLARDKSAPLAIAEAAVRAAVLNFGGGSVSGIIFKPVDGATPDTATLPRNIPALAGVPAFVQGFIDVSKVAEFYQARHPIGAG